MKTEQELLIYGAKIGNLEMVKLAVEHGADIHAQDNYALRWASRNGHLEVIKYLKSINA